MIRTSLRLGSSRHEAVTWVKDGTDGGTGTIVAENPHNF